MGGYILFDKESTNHNNIDNLNDKLLVLDDLDNDLLDSELYDNLNLINDDSININDNESNIYIDAEDYDLNDEDEEDYNELFSNESDHDSDDSADDNLIDETKDTEDVLNDDYNNQLDEFRKLELNQANFMLTVTAEIGNVTMSLQQLLALQIGDVFDFAGLPVAVRLMTNGLYIGDGHLVEINGRVGVKIFKLSGNHGTICTD
jgi:flagellar motor switch/type III secretory pathway protein FliN